MQAIEKFLFGYSHVKKLLSLCFFKSKLESLSLTLKSPLLKNPLFTFNICTHRLCIMDDFMSIIIITNHNNNLLFQVSINNKIKLNTFLK